MKSFEQTFFELISGYSKGFKASFARRILCYFSKIYAHIISKRNERFDRDATKSHRVTIPVISVGNITTGGTGKTPMVRYICEFLQQHHCKPAILSRGYKAQDNRIPLVVSDGSEILLSPKQSGDEAYLLSYALPRVPILIGRKRFESAKKAIQELKPDVLVLDDGFQHRQLRRDLDIVLIDATLPFGFGYVLPRGLLREPLYYIRRAHVIVITKIDQCSEHELHNIEERLHGLAPEALLVKSKHAPQWLVSLKDWKKGTDERDLLLPCKRVLALTGIGNPQSFVKTLQEADLEVISTIFFEDHHEFTKDDILYAFAEAKSHQAEGLVITEKDAVKIAQFFDEISNICPIYVLGIEIDIKDGEGNFQKLLMQVGKDKEV